MTSSCDPSSAKATSETAASSVARVSSRLSVVSFSLARATGETRTDTRRPIMRPSSSCHCAGQQRLWGWVTPRPPPGIRRRLLGPLRGECLVPVATSTP